MENRFTPTTWIGSWPVNRNGIEIVDVFSWGLEFRLYNPIVQVWSAGVVHQSKAPKNQTKKNRKKRKMNKRRRTNKAGFINASIKDLWLGLFEVERSIGRWLSERCQYSTKPTPRETKPARKPKQLGSNRRKALDDKQKRAGRAMIVKGIDAAICYPLTVSFFEWNSQRDGTHTNDSSIAAVTMAERR